MRTWASFISLAAVITLSWCLCGCAQFDTQAHPLPAPATVQYIGQWGTKGDGPGQLDNPASIATDAMGNVYIADGGSEFIHKLDPQGTPLLSFQEGGLKHPQWIALDRGGAIYVSDPLRSSVYIFLPEGERYRVLHLRSRPSDENEISVAVSDDGLIHVFDSSADTVFTFTPRMRLVQKWRTSAKGSDTSGRLGPIAMGPNSLLYMADTSVGRMLRFAGDGHFDSAIDLGSDENHRRLSHEFAVSSNGVFVMDADGVTLHVWGLDGTPKLDVDLSSELGHDSRVPPPLAVSPRGELLILDAPRARVLRYHINF